MHPHSSPIGSARSSLADHLHHLRVSLTLLGQRLRDAVAELVGQTVARVVREAMRVFLSETPSELPDRDPEPAQFQWEDPYERRWPEEPGARLDDDHDDYYLPSEAPQQPPTEHVGWRRVLALVCRVATWWLRRRRWPYPILTSIGVGLASAATVYASGPAIAVGTGLVGSALSLAILTDLIESGARTLAVQEAP